MPPRAGTTEAQLIAEIASAPPELDLAATLPALAKRPLALLHAHFGASRAEERRMVAAAKAAGATQLSLGLWETDRSFSDKRIALQNALVTWLAQIATWR